MEVVQQVEDDVACCRDKIVVPADAVGVHRRCPASVGQEGRGQSDVLHRFEWRLRYVTAGLAVSAGLVWAIIKHRHTVADQLHMGQLFSRNRGHKTVEWTQLVL